MPRLVKGSQEAKQWALKMKQAKQAKKMNGGSIKSIGRAFNNFGNQVQSGFSTATQAISKPIAQASSAIFGNKNLNNVGIALGNTTNDYLLPAVVEMGKPIYTGTAMLGSTLLTGNPVLGKIAADALWENMGAKYDPSQNQKSALLGNVSKIVGEVAAESMGGKLQKRQNPWISHVKMFASHNNMPYREALKHPQCKTTYRRNI